MALKGAFTFLEMVKRLTRGYVRETGRQPDNLAKLKINMEAAERIKQQNVVTEFPKDKITPFNEPRPGDVKKNVEPIKKFLSDKEATAQINKLKEDFDFNDRVKVLQLFDDIDAGKAFGAFDDIQRKELRDMISDMYTRKPEFASGGIAGQLHMNEGGRARFQVGGNSLEYVSTPSNYRSMPSNLTYEQAVQWNKEEKNRQEALSRAQYQKMQAMTDPNFQIDYDKFSDAYNKNLMEQYGSTELAKNYMDTFELQDPFYIDPDTGAKSPREFSDLRFGKPITRYEQLALDLETGLGRGYFNPEGNQLTDPTYVGIRQNLQGLLGSEAAKQMLRFKESRPGYQPRTLGSVIENKLAELELAQRNKLAREDPRRYDELMVQTQPGYARNVEAYNRRRDLPISKAMAPGQSVSDYLTQAGDIYGLTTEQLWNYRPSAYKEVAHEPKSTSFNVMKDEKGNVMKDQSMAEYLRDAGVNPNVGEDYPVNNMADLLRPLGPSEGIGERSDYNLTPGMQAARARGIDPRMARSYQENIRLMGDPRMHPPMPMGGTPIGVMPPPPTGRDPGYFSNPNVSEANPGGYASEQEAIADLGIERYNQLYAKGGRIGFTGGTGGNTYQDFLADKTVRPHPDDKSWRDVFYRWLDKQRANQAKGGLAHILGV